VALSSPASRAHAAELFSSLDALAGQLKNGDSVQRRDAVDKLEAYGTDEVRPLLLRAIGDSDTEVRVHAATAIGRHHVAEATGALTAALGDSDARLRTSAAEALGLVLEGRAANEPAAPTLRALEALERALGDGEHEVREAAVIALGRLPATLGRRAAVALTGRLDDEAAGVRQRAAEVLGRMGETRAAVPLLARLGDTTREVRAAALEALALLGDVHAVPAMVRMLRDPAEDVRATAVTALGRLRSPAAIAPLEETMTRGQPDALRARAAFALGQIASAPASAPTSSPASAPAAGNAGKSSAGKGSAGEANGAAAVDALMTALGHDELSAAASEALVRAGAAAVPALLARLPDAANERATLYVDLLRQIAATGDTRATPLLLDELARGRLGEEPIVDALGAMLHAGDKRPLVELVARLGAPSPSLRRHAAAALQGVVDARAAAALATAASDSEAPVRLMAIGELGRLGAREALPMLAHALAAGDEETAAAAAHALGQLDDRRATAPLVAALGRPERRVRREAADALAHLGDAAVAPAIMRAVRSSAPDRRAGAIVALGGVLRRHPDSAARELLLGYAEDSDAASALAAIDALGAMADAAAAPRLARLVDGRADTGLRQRALGALGDLDSDDATRTLGSVLSADLDPRLRAEAAWALGKRPRAAATATPLLTQALQSPAPAVRANAAAALYRLQAAPAALLRLLDDRDPAVRGNAALALGKTPSARSALARLAERDEDRLVRAAAKQALQARAPSSAADWIALDVVDFDGSPLGDARYRLALPDGLVKAGVTDERGIVAEEALPTGGCALVLDEAAVAR
jgi:HEAT repeat protein